MDGDLLRSPEKWPWVRIWFRNVKTNQSQVIFEGYLENTTQSFMFSNTEVAVTIRHWLYAFDAHPVISSYTHPTSAADFTQMLYYKAIPASFNAETEAGSFPHRSIFKLAAADMYPGGYAEIAKDAGKNGYVRTLELLTKLTDFYTPFDLEGLHKDAILQPDIELSVKDIIANRIRTGEAENNPLEPDQFPKLKLNPAWGNNDIAQSVFQNIEKTDLSTAQANSMWSAFVNLAANFSFMIVPRVHDVRIIPKWFTPVQANPKRLNGIVAVNGTWSHARPVGAVIMLPTASSGIGLSSRSIYEMMDITNRVSVSHYGRYQPPHKPPGTLLVRQRPGWSSSINLYNVANPTNPGEQKKGGPDTSNEDSGEPSGEKEIKKEAVDFYNTLAEEAYWDEMLKGVRMEVMTPIRFDVCPGSFVSVKTGSDVRIEANEGDALSTEYYGFVLSMRLTFDTMNASASAQYTLSHVHDQAVNGKLLKSHPMYDCAPFSSAFWTARPFQTIEGSE